MIDVPDADHPLICERLRPRIDYPSDIVGSSHPWSEVIWLTEGAVDLRYGTGAGAGGRVQRLSAGAVFYNPAGVDHASAPADPNAGMGMLLFKLHDPTAAGAEPIVLDDPSSHLHALLAWLSELHLGRPRPPGTLAGHLLAAVCEALRQAGTAHLPDPLTPEERVALFMQENLPGDLPIGELCAVAGLSPAQLQRRFQARYGCTPIRHLQQLRVAAACDLLTTTRLPLDTIARRVGFNSRSHLTRLIRRFTGRTVREWRP